MLILKVHYFLWFGSLSGVLPYISVFGKQYSSATATEIGILYTVLPFVAMLAKPIGCACADRFSAHKLVLVSSLILTLLGFGSLILVPWFVEGSSCTWWFYCSAVLLANSAMGVVITMTDSLAMREVSTGRSSFGFIRVFGTLGYGILGLVAGKINQKLLTGLPYLLPGLIMFVVVICIDILAIVLFFRDSGISVTELSSEAAGQEVGGGRRDGEEDGDATDVGKTVMKSFISFPPLFYYCFLVFMCGLLTAFHWSFFNWFIDSIQEKDTLLMGWCLLVQSFLGEVPFFLFSEWIVQKIGFDHSLSVTFLSIAIRYLSYGFLIKKGHAYYVLIVELTQGPCFGLFYVVMTAIAQTYSVKTTALLHAQPSKEDASHDQATNATESPSKVVFDVPDLVVNNCPPATKGMDPRERTYATMQGIMSAVYEGAGLGIGALIAGVCIDRMGSESAWILAGFISLAVCTSNLLLTLNLDKCSRS